MRYIVIVFVMMVHVSVAETTSQLYDNLSAEVDRSNIYLTQREHKIAELKSAAKYCRNKETLMEVYDQLFNCYYDYQYDSAMAYVKKELMLSKKMRNRHFEVLALMHRTLLLSIAGFYSDGQQCMNIVDSMGVPDNQKKEYWKTRYLFTSFRYDYYRGSEFDDKLRKELLFSVPKAMGYTERGSVEYDFYNAIYQQYLGNSRKAVVLWKKLLRRLRPGSSYYSQSACNLAVCYRNIDDAESYEKWLIRAAISDIRCATRQEIAMLFLVAYMYSKPDVPIRYAEKFINFSLNNARGYNSRMRLMGIAKEWSAIITAYQQELQTNNHNLNSAIAALSLLVASIVVGLFYVKRQNTKLSASMGKLGDSYNSIDELNNKLEQANEQLLDVNIKREALIKVYIDLCDRYINRLKSFKKFVSRKIKSGQVRDLMSRLSAAELTQEEASDFLRHFDKAFLQVYPTFVSELNTLLRDDAQLKQLSDTEMSIEQRVAALIRLGVCDSSEIANLLFYSPQTVYNYRWNLKKKALDKTTFEQDVKRLCRYH